MSTSKPSRRPVAGSRKLMRLEPVSRPTIRRPRARMASRLGVGGCGAASAGVGRRLAVRLVHEMVVVGVGLGGIVASAGSGGSGYDAGAALLGCFTRFGDGGVGEAWVRMC